MSKWVKIRYHSGNVGQVLQVSDAVATSMVQDAALGTEHKQYSVEDYPGLRGNSVTPGVIVIHWEDIAEFTGYEYSPYPPPE